MRTIIANIIVTQLPYKKGLFIKVTVESSNVDYLTQEFIKSLFYAKIIEKH